jgi:hypothetical protein
MTESKRSVPLTSSNPRGYNYNFGLDETMRALQLVLEQLATANKPPEV